MSRLTAPNLPAETQTRQHWPPASNTIAKGLPGY
jgi:hypothetical protein